MELCCYSVLYLESINYFGRDFWFLVLFFGGVELKGVGDYVGFVFFIFSNVEDVVSYEI